MGDVWRGEHRGKGQEVALKVVALQEGTGRSLEAFRREVRAVAALDHAGIIRVHDHGLVRPALVEQSGGLLLADSAWLAMELADGGALSSFRGRLSWPVLRRLLLSLLDALAHAHARGVIHRDLKPSNVLFGGPGGEQLKLSDFGLAHALGRPHGSTSMAGTPAYMAPEQFLGRWRAFGPWTDLYALGCTCWELVTGTPPFSGRELSQQMQAHLQQEPPALQALITVPPELESWLRRLLAKRPEDRFQRAADAAWALMGLSEVGGAPEGGLVLGGPRPTQDLPQQSVALTWVSEVIGQTLVPPQAPPRLPMPPLVSSGPLMERVLPPLPDTPGAHAGAAQGTPGLGLLGLRTLPLLDREDERAWLWKQLRGRVEDGQPHMVVLRGPAGIGKSRLCAWLSERAHELGVAQVFYAHHTPTGGPAEGLTGMVARHLHAAGLSRQGLRSSLEERMGDTEALRLEALALTELLRPMEPGGGLRSARERHALVRGVLERAQGQGLEQGRRVILLWLDDVQWGRDALHFAGRLLTEAGFDRLPVLILATARTEALVESPAAEALLNQVLPLPRVSVRDIGPLPPDDQQALVRHELGVGGALAQAIEARSAGNPLFAQQLVGDLVERGQLVEGDGGFELREGAELRLPDDLYTVWGERVRELLVDRPFVEDVLLSIAAALGSDVVTREWLLAARAWGLTGDRLEAVSAGLVERLTRRSLARRSTDGWRFVHGMLRDAILRRAEEAGQLGLLHLACARALEQRYGDAPDLQARLAQHFMGAEHYQEAISPLERAFRYARRLSDLESVTSLVDAREEALLGAQIREVDPRWIEGLLARSFVLRAAGRFEDSREVLEQALALAQEARDPAFEIRIGRHLAESMRQQGLAAEAEARFAALLPLAQEFGDLRLTALIMEGLANCARVLLRVDEARDHILAAQRLYLQVGDTAGEATCRRGLGNLARSQGDLRSAQVEVGRALIIYERLGERLGMANCLNDLGDFHRFSGRQGAAREHYQRALALYESLGSYAALYPQFNLCLLLLGEGSFGEARRQLLALRARSRRSGILVMNGSIALALAACAAATRDWVDYDKHLGEGRAALARSGDMDHDNAWPARLAGELALQAGETERALTALTIARVQFDAIGADALAREVQSLLDSAAPMAT